MNKDNAKDYLPLVQALADGKTLQYYHTDQVWIDCNEISFADDPNYYRIASASR